MTPPDPRLIRRHGHVGWVCPSQDAENAQQDCLSSIFLQLQRRQGSRRAISRRPLWGPRKRLELPSKPRSFLCALRLACTRIYPWTIVQGQGTKLSHSKHGRLRLMKNRLHLKASILCRRMQIRSQLDIYEKQGIGCTRKDIVTLKTNSLIAVIYLVVWIISPLLTVADGSFWEEHASVPEVAAGRTLLAAVDAVEVKSMNNVSADVFEAFSKSHINFKANNDGSHTHISFDACCGTGGLVCDASTLADANLCNVTQFHSWEEAIDAHLTSIDIPTLRHPPKQNA